MTWIYLLNILIKHDKFEINWSHHLPIFQNQPATFDSSLVLDTWLTLIFMISRQVFFTSFSGWCKFMKNWKLTINFSRVSIDFSCLRSLNHKQKCGQSFTVLWCFALVKRWLDAHDMNCQKPSSSNSIVHWVMIDIFSRFS